MLWTIFIFVAFFLALRGGSKRKLHKNCNVNLPENASCSHLRINSAASITAFVFFLRSDAPCIAAGGPRLTDAATSTAHLTAKYEPAKSPGRSKSPTVTQ